MSQWMLTIVRLDECSKPRQLKAVENAEENYKAVPVLHYKPSSREFILQILIFFVVVGMHV